MTTTPDKTPMARYARVWQQVDIDGCDDGRIAGWLMVGGTDVGSRIDCLSGLLSNMTVDSHPTLTAFA